MSLQSALEMKNEVVPTQRNVRDSAMRRLKGGEISALEFLDVQRDFNEVVKRLRDSLVRHRRAMLDLNTAVGVRIVP